MFTMRELCCFSNPSSTGPLETPQRLILLLCVVCCICSARLILIHPLRGKICCKLCLSVMLCLGMSHSESCLNIFFSLFFHRKNRLPGLRNKSNILIQIGHFLEISKTICQYDKKKDITKKSNFKNILVTKT